MEFSVYLCDLAMLASYWAHEDDSKLLPVSVGSSNNFWKGSSLCCGYPKQLPPEAHGVTPSARGFPWDDNQQTEATPQML